VGEAVGGTLHAWVEEIREAELNTDQVRNQLRPLLAEFVRQELTDALKVKRNGKR